MRFIKTTNNYYVNAYYIKSIYFGMDSFKGYVYAEYKDNDTRDKLAIVKDLKEGEYIIRTILKFLSDSETDCFTDYCLNLEEEISILRASIETRRKK